MNLDPVILNRDDQLVAAREEEEKIKRSTMCEVTFVAPCYPLAPRPKDTAYSRAQVCQTRRRRQVHQDTLGQRWAPVMVSLSCLICVLMDKLQQVSSASSMFTNEAGQSFVEQSMGGSSGRSSHLQLSQFDSSQFKSVYEAIRAHPDLREFAALCESDGVKQIVSMDKMPLTVFAPIDRSLNDLLAKSKARSINLIELAKHHISQGSVMPDENTKYPLQFYTYSLLSPIYLNQLPLRPSNGAHYFVNNAKILATHLIPIDGGESYQTLHLIDQALEFAYVNKKTQLRHPATPASPMGGAGLSGGVKKATTKRSAFNLDDFFVQHEGAYEFYERFAGLQAAQAQVDLYNARAFKGSQQLERLKLSQEEFDLERLARALRQHPQLRGKLYQVNESATYNTYFLPLNSEELGALLHSGDSSALTFAAHVIPDQVLFTRTMPLGSSHASLFDRLASAEPQQVSLSLAKTMPERNVLDLTSSEFDSSLASGGQFLATPLLLQSKCTAGQHGGQLQSEATPPPVFRAGITSAEILVANIPLTNGVLHLIRRPILVTDTNVLEYLNDNNNQLSDVVDALGSQTSCEVSKSSKGLDQNSLISGQNLPEPVKVNRFRELLARERQMLSNFQMEPQMNKTILAPSDEAFARLRYDLRALVQADEALIPSHWDASYRHDLLERLLKRHVIFQQTLTTDQLTSEPRELLSENGKALAFSARSSSSSCEYLVESDSTRARLVHHDLIGTNGVLHIIDRVLGEEQETVYSLLKSIVLRFNHSLEETQVNQNELGQLIQANIKGLSSSNSNQHAANEHQATISPANSIQADNNSGENERRLPNPELSAISRAIGQYLDELASTNRRQLNLLAQSVNISYNLARLTSMAEGLDDWNKKFEQPDRLFTYFVPSDLAWIRLQQSQPELYKPLMHFLELHQSTGPNSGTGAEVGNSIYLEPAVKAARSSESSHRLRQILERHLVVDRKLARRELSQLDSLHTLGATLRLVEPAAGQQQQLTAVGDGSSGTLNRGAYAASLHSITASQQISNGNNNNSNKLKSLRLGDSAPANIVQANEASNGYVYVIDNVLLLPSDSDYIVQTASGHAATSSMSSLLGAHNSAILDFIHGLLAPAPFNLSAHSILALIGALMVAILVLLVLALVLVVRRKRQSKLNRHQQLESGLTSSSSANSGSTSTTKSL